MVRQIHKFFSSIKLTVACLGFAVILVFAGTVAQVDLGLLNAQNLFFRSFFVYWTVPGGGVRIPVMPGGYLVGSFLLINLIVVYSGKLKTGKKKAGILMIHSGVILLLLGQLATDMLQVESHMRLGEGETKNYSENGRQSELVFVDQSDPTFDDVIAIPEPRLAKEGEIRHEKLPFPIKIVKYHLNSRLSLRAPMVDKDPPAATEGEGKRLRLEAFPPTTKMDERNLPSVVFEVPGPSGGSGTWLASLALENPQSVTVGSKTYQVSMRPVRYYKPFSLQLLKFSHDKYLGTDIPKNFSSRVRIQHKTTGEDREVLIFMNSPLRYNGETYYQAGFDDKQPGVTILQVVRNPGWLTPYLSCILVGAGLLTQFMTHLVGFVRERKKQKASAA